jgi:hypothetical protein
LVRMSVSWCGRLYARRTINTIAQWVQRVGAGQSSLRT